MRFPKQPERLVSDAALKAYRDAHPRCEVRACPNEAAPEPHHLVPRSRGRNDAESNLLSLCLACHGLWHHLGGHEWFRRYGDALGATAKAKVEAALRLEAA